MSPFRRSLQAAAVAGIALGWSLPAGAASGQIPERFVDQVRSLAQDPTVLITLRADNAQQADMAQKKIEELDTQWRKETDSEQKPLIAEVMAAPLSTFLMRRQAAAHGQVIEVFVMGRSGLSVGTSAVTSDYWQGDEAKFRKTFGEGPGAIHYGPVEIKDSGHRAQQVSMTVSDPDTGRALGAITAEFDLDVIASRRGQ